MFVFVKYGSRSTLLTRVNVIIVPHTEMFQFCKFSGFSLTKIPMITVNVFNSTLQLIR